TAEGYGVRSSVTVVQHRRASEEVITAICLDGGPCLHDHSGLRQVSAASLRRSSERLIETSYHKPQQMAVFVIFEHNGENYQTNRGIKNSTRGSNAATLKNHILRVLGSKNLMEITPTHISHFSEVSPISISIRNPCSTSINWLHHVQSCRGT